MKIKTMLFVPAIILIWFFLTGPVMSQAGQSEVKIATVSLQHVIAQSKAGQEAQQALETELLLHQTALQKYQQELETMRSEIEKKSAVWSNEIKTEKEMAYQKKVREFGLKNEEAKFQLQQLEQKVMEPILKELEQVIFEIGKKQKFTMIFENTMKGLRTKTGLLFAAEYLDISELVRQSLDERLAE